MSDLMPAMAEDEMKDEKGTIKDRQGATPAGGTGSKAPARRGFLAGVGAAGVAGAAVIAAGRNGAPVAVEAAGQAVPAQAVAGRGYHETDHIRRYYDTAKV
jgi:hypothetical protein